jgi:hypothetical protein
MKPFNDDFYCGKCFHKFEFPEKFIMLRIEEVQLAAIESSVLEVEPNEQDYYRCFGCFSL